MKKDAKALLQRVMELADRHIDAQKVATAKRRQADMFAWRQTDYVPLIPVPTTLPLQGDDWPSFDWAEQFCDPAASLYMQIRDVVMPQVLGGGDYVPAVRADTGVINGPSILGAPYNVPPHTKPVISGHVSYEALRDLSVPSDIRSLGCMPTMIAHTQHHLAALKAAGLYGRIGIHHCDLQGPFDIAAQARGHDAIFLDLYIDTAFVHELMAKCTDIFIRMAALSKTLVGDAMDSGLANDYWMGAGSVRLCDDSGILVSPDLYREHLAPYIGKAMAPFGGGWIHYCGGVPNCNLPEGLHLHESYLSQKPVRALQFTTAGDLPAEVRRLREHKVAWLAVGWRETLSPDGVQTHETLFKRMIALCDVRRGMVVTAKMDAAELPGAVEMWHRLQDEAWK